MDDWLYGSITGGTEDKSNGYTIFQENREYFNIMG